MTIKRSGFSDPTNYFPKVAPVFDNAPNTSAMDSIILLCSRNEDLQIQYKDNQTSGSWVDLDDRFYLQDGKFLYPTVLETGSNTIYLRTLDILGSASTQTSHVITRVKKDSVRYRTRSWSINGVTQDNKYLVAGPVTDMRRKEGIFQMSFTVQGNGRPVLARDDVISYTIDDGLASSTYSAVVISGKTTMDGIGSVQQEVMAQSTIDRLPRLTYTGSLRGTYNGDILRQLAKAAGYASASLYIPRGHPYVGPRAMDNRKVYEDIIKEILFIESWQLHQKDADTLVVYPSAVNRYVSWTFNDSQIVSLGDEFDGSFRFNKARLVYEPLEDDENFNGVAEDLVPDKSTVSTATLTFYKSDYFQVPLIEAAPDSVLFFAAYGSDSKKYNADGTSKQIDWDNIVTARAIIKFNNTNGEPNAENGGNLLKYHVDMEVFPDKQVAVGFFDLRPNHLIPNLPVYYQWMVVDIDGNYIGNTPNYDYFKLSGETTANFEKLATKFGVEMTEVKELGTVYHAWDPIDSAEDGPGVADSGVFYARYDENGDKIRYEFYIEKEINDVVWSTIYFDLDNSTASTGDPAHLVNCELVTSGNQLINGNKYIHGVRPHLPNIPVKRADKLLFKFIGEITKGEKISLKFTIYGREFISAASGFEDFTKINVPYTDEQDVATRTAAGLEPAVLDGGTILSGFVSTKDQATEKIRRVVTASAQDAVTESLITQGYSEMREGQILRIFSNRAGQAYNTYYLITSVKPDNNRNDIRALRTRTVIVDPDTGYTEPYAPEVPYDLTDMIKEIAKGVVQFQFGQVTARKYRGMFRVKLDSGIEVKHVLSRVEPVKSGDRVAVVQSSAGTYLIIEVLKPSMSNNEFEEILTPDDELAEEWGDALASATAAGEDLDVNESLNTESLPTEGRPLANFITMEKIEVSAQKDGLIAYTGTYFDVTLSHDTVATRTTSRTATDQQWYTINATNFFFIDITTSDYEGVRNVLFTVQKVDNKVYRLTPRTPLPFSATVKVGIAPITQDHPSYRHYYRGDQIDMITKIGQEKWRNRELRSLAGFQILPDYVLASLVQEWSESFTVQPQLTIEIADIGPTWVDFQFNQPMDTSSTKTVANWFVDLE